jgi:hypothetical protein
MGEAFRSGRPARARLALDPARMAEQILSFDPASDAEALRLLRATYPEYPLSARVAALHLMLRRQPLRPPQSPR